MRKRYRIHVFLSILLAVVLIVSLVIPCLGQTEKPLRPFDWDLTPEELENLRESMSYYFMVKSVIASLNTILILGLVVIHLKIYRKTGTKFSLGLVLFSIALLLYTLAANPFLHNLIGFRRIGFGPLFIIPDLFTLLASAILIHLSRQ